MNEAQGKAIVFMSIGRIDSNEKKFEIFGFAVIWVITSWEGLGAVSAAGWWVFRWYHQLATFM